MVVILTGDEILARGLELAGFDRDRRQIRVNREQNVSRFKSHYGSEPIVYAQIWEDLQTTTNLEACIDMKKADIDSFLLAIFFLKCYEVESLLAGRFKICEKTARAKIWYFVKKIQALKHEKVITMIVFTIICSYILAPY
jgi:hypothetical protein